MLIIGTAGHIDHGKTTLIGALTGAATDRLKEEQERGISIELGFAYMDLPNGNRCGVIDVPGHERFVRQMIAGATGIDLVLLVIAADEGVMQQTREHLDICRLLGIERGMIVLTKTDMVDDDWLELVESDVHEQVSETFLNNAPILHFSSKKPETTETVRAAIATMAQQIEDNRNNADHVHPLRIPIDRVFTMQGFGTVITGTVGSGEVAVGDAVSILPEGRRCKVRGIQSHNESIDKVHVGQRAAINLQGIDKVHVHRGNVVSHAEGIQATRMLDVELAVLPQVPSPVTSQAKALVHVGTSQVTGTVVLLEDDEIQPGHSGLVQLRLDQFVVALAGERIVLRGFELMPSYGKTIGGGVILHPLPSKHRRLQEPVLRSLRALRDGEPREMVERAVHLAGLSALTLSTAKQVLSACPTSPESTLNELVQQGVLTAYTHDGKRQYVHQDYIARLLERAESTITDYHRQYPQRGGIPREELRSKIRQALPARLFVELVDKLAASGNWLATETLVLAVDFEPSLSEDQKSLSGKILRQYQRAGLEPPSTQDVVNELTETANTTKTEVKELMDLLIAQGELVRIQQSLLFAREHVQAMEEKVISFLQDQGTMTTPQLKELTGTSRKYTVPLAEYLDAKQVTIRMNDVRKLRNA